MPRLRLLLHWLVFVALVPRLLHAAPGEPQAPAAQALRAGYLIDLQLRGSTLTAVSVADITNYIENKHIRSDDDWRVLLLNAPGQPIGTRLIGNPYRFSPRLGDEQALPLTIKVPAVPALAAVVVQDQRQQERLRIPIDNAFRGRAAAARARFLAHDGENRRLIREAAARRATQRGKGQAAAAESRAVHMDALPREMRDRVISDTAEEMEALLRFGPDTLNAAHALSLAPEQVAQAAIPGTELRPAAGAARKGESAGPYTVTGFVTDANTGAPLVNAGISVYQYAASGAYVEQTFVHTDAGGRYSCGIAAGQILVSGPWASRYVGAFWRTPVSGSLTHDIQGQRGVVLSGRVMNELAQGIGGVMVHWRSSDTLYGNTTSDASGNYSMTAPVNTPFTVFVNSVPVPYLAPPAETDVILSGDTVRNVTLSRGVGVLGLVSGDGGAAVPGAAVLVRQIVSTSTNPRSWSQTTDSAGRYSLVLPPNLFPRDFVISVYASGYVRSTTALTATTDVTHDVALVRGVTVSGLVTNSAGTAQQNVRVRAFQAGSLVLSTLTDASGAYSLTLAPGIYDLAAVPSGGQQMASVSVPNLALTVPTTQNFGLPSVGGSVTLRLHCGATYSGCGTFARMEIRQGARTVAAFLGAGIDNSGRPMEMEISVLWDSIAGQYYYSAGAAVAPGQYDVVAYILGLAPVTFPGVQVAGNVTLTATLPPPFLWTGTLRGGDGAPIPGSAIYSFDDTTHVWAVSSTDAAGRFSVRMTPGGFVKFHTNEGTRNILHTERFGNVTASRNGDCVLDAFPAFTDAGSALTQMYGVADRNSRWNIVMIGDGYTDVHETYTDVNGNGQWDGVVYYDVNRDGVWNAQLDGVWITCEPYRMCGAAPFPADGTDARLGNEPFVDVNGDAVLSRDDQALFDRNTLDLARSLLGQDVWRDHREAFNIFRIRVVSAQAGHDVRDANNNTVVDRNTALGTYLANPGIGWPFNADDSLVSQYINEYVPETDTRIVVVNQPIQMGRVTSYMFSYGGDHISNMGNGTIVAHEMGHNVGGLADEYTSSIPTFADAEVTAANVTALSTLDTIPWKLMVTPGKELPSVPSSGGVGLFEGAQYVLGGKYRPTEYCMMAAGARFCPVCTNELEIRMHDIGVPVPAATLVSPANTVTGTTPTFTWQPQAGVSHYLLEVERASGGALVASFDVYATSFTLASPLAPGTYRWRLRGGSTTNWAEWSSWSAFTAAIGPTFTDDPLIAGVTVVKAVHVTELRQAIAALRVRDGLSSLTWTDAVLDASTPIRAVHVSELRTALVEVYAAAGRAVPVYTRPLAAMQTVIAAVDFAELREAVRAIW